jgi:hypothetical protein
MALHPWSESTSRFGSLVAPKVREGFDRSPLDPVTSISVHRHGIDKGYIAGTMITFFPASARHTVPAMLARMPKCGPSHKEDTGFARLEFLSLLLTASGEVVLCVGDVQTR